MKLFGLNEVLCFGWSLGMNPTEKDILDILNEVLD